MVHPGGRGDDRDPADMAAADVIGGNVYDKYGSRNPVVRAIMAGFFRDLDALAARAAPESVIEAGCGEGEIAARLALRVRSLAAFDLDPGCVETARARLQSVAHARVFHASVLDPPAGLSADLVVCCEVLEHVPDPTAALEQVAAMTRRYVLLSVPREPLWRALNLARLKYVGALGNTPGHIQHWSRRGFEAFVGRRLRIVERRSPVPWTMLLAEQR